MNAVECLASVGADPKTPEGPGPAGLFVNFMKEHAPGAPGRNKLDAIYDTRSALTHGSRLLSLDLPSRGGWALSQTSSLDRDVGDAASVLCRWAILNWLWAHDDANTSHLVTAGLREAPAARPGTKAGLLVIIPEVGDSTD